MELYSIYAKVKTADKPSNWDKMLNTLYDGIVNHDFRGNLSFKEKPTEEDVIGLLRLLRPDKEFYLGSVRIEYIMELKENY